MFRRLLWSGAKFKLQEQPKASYQNFVMNETLSRLKGGCEDVCPTPRFPPRKVTVLGAGTDVGRIACLFLKQQRIIRILSMYDEYPANNVLGAATDIAHIDTSPAIEAYQGRMFLQNALWDADVVVICGGAYNMPPGCNKDDKHLFLENLKYVRSFTLATSKFAPHAILAVQTPPVDATFALVKHTLITAKAYDKRKVLGMNTINSMRANQLFCNAVGSDPSSSSLPVICGTCRTTRVPCFSSKAASGGGGQWSSKKAECLTRLVRGADDLICKVKSNNEQGHLSIGYSIARVATNLMKGIFEGSAVIDSALVDQGDPKACFNLETCATPVKVGKSGIQEYMIPSIDGYESKLLETSKNDLNDLLNLGRCYATGDKYLFPKFKEVKYKFKECPVVTPCPKRSKKD